MKTLILIGAGFFITNMLFSQVFLKTGSGWIEKTVTKGDTVRLAVEEFRGTLQWQYSTDGSSWTDYPGQTGERLDFIAVEGIYIRLAVSSENCDPVYSGVVHFLVIEPNEGTFVDTRDGKRYRWKKIGDQIWMAENLAWLPAVSPPAQGASSSPHYYVYGYEGTSAVEAKQSNNYLTYGVLYNFEAAKASCPEGWHLPADNEWKTLEKTLGMSDQELNAAGWRLSGNVGNQLKEFGSLHWWSPNAGATNSSGFTALPGGMRERSGSIAGLGQIADFYSSTGDGTGLVWRRHLYYEHGAVSRANTYPESGCSVRCIRN